MVNALCMSEGVDNEGEPGGGGNEGKTVKMLLKKGEVLVT